MFEKILLKLKAQRGTTSNVSDRSLEDLARSLETLIPTEEILAVADLSKAITSIDGNINHYTAEQVKNALKTADEKKLEEAEKLKVKKAAELLAKQKKKDGQGTDDPPEWVQTILDQNAKMSADIQSFKADKTTTSRKEKLNKVLEGMPEYLTNPIKASFTLAKFESDESFTTYLQGIEKSNATFVQAAKEQGLNMSTPTVNVKVPKETGQTPELGGALDLLNKQKEKKNGTD